MLVKNFSQKKLRRQRELPPIEKIYKFTSILTDLQKKLLNLGFSDVTSKTYAVGEYDLPYVKAKITKYPDYNIAELKDFYLNRFARVKYYRAGLLTLRRHK